jgi:putative tricarboxylic transport membrane protein
MLEETLKQSLIIFDHNPMMFFSRPIVVTLFVVTALSVTAPLLFRAFRRLLRGAPDLDPISE